MAGGGASGTETHLDLEEAARKGFFKELILGQVLEDHLVLGGKEQGLGVWTGFALLMAEGKNPGVRGERNREGRRGAGKQLHVEN